MATTISANTRIILNHALTDPVATNEIIAALQAPVNATGNVGFFGVTPVVRQTGGALTAGGTYTANEQSMIQKAYAALQAYGLLT